MDALQVRVAAAHELVDKGLLDGMLALSYVIFPSEAVEAASALVAAEGGVGRRCSDATRLRALELVDAGMSWAQAAREVGVAKTTVGTWIRKRKLAPERCHSVATPPAALTLRRRKPRVSRAF
jgi:hypothetical protein